MKLPRPGGRDNETRRLVVVVLVSIGRRSALRLGGGDCGRELVASLNHELPYTLRRCHSTGPASAAQPFTVDQVRAGALSAHTRTPEALYRFLVRVLCSPASLSKARDTPPTSRPGARIPP
jgi:hypothetical protein